MRAALLVLAGMIIMYILLKFMASKESESQAWQRTKDLIKTQEFNNLMRTNEFREIAKSNEFRSLIGTLAEDQIITVSKTLVG